MHEAIGYHGGSEWWVQVGEQGLPFTISTLLQLVQRGADRIVSRRRPVLAQNTAELLLLQYVE